MSRERRLTYSAQLVRNGGSSAASHHKWWCFVVPQPQPSVRLE
jgi:hypothetical protein